MTALADPIVRVAGLSAEYGNVQALDGVDLQVRPGELLGVTGENGSGKSTLMRCLIADLAAVRGGVEVAPGTRVALAWQEPALCDNLDVAANLLLGQERGWTLSLSSAHSRARAMLATLSLDPGRTTDLAGDLTGAKRQLLAVAKAAVAGPDLLLLDEPTADLGVEDTARVEELIQRLHAGGTTIVLVSHEVEQLFRLTQRVVVLRRGKVVGEVDPARDHPDDVVALMSGMELESSAYHQLTRLHALTDRLASADPSSSLLMILTALGTALGADQLAMHVASGEERLRLACSLGIPEELRRRWDELPYGASGGPMGLAAASERTIVDPDIRAGLTWRPFFEPAWRAQVASSWAVPFAGTEGLRGVITVLRDRIGRPSRDELDLAYLYGGYAASAIERDRLVGELTSRNLVLETIRDVLETLAGPVPLDEALGTALRALLRGVAADEAAVFSTHPDGSTECRALMVAPGVTSPTGKAGWMRMLSTPGSSGVVNGLVNGRAQELGPEELGIGGWGMAVTFASPEGVDTLAVVRRRGTPTEETGSLLEDAAHSIRLALEREQAQRAMQETAALRRSEQLQRDFLARLSHELRTPLTAIGGYADTLMQNDVIWDAESHDRFLSRIGAESHRLRRLVDDLLDHSAIESGVLRLQRDWCDLELLLDAARSCLHAEARSRVHLKVSSDVPTIWADHDRLEQVFLNLLDNAVRHNPPGTQVDVQACCPEPDLVTVMVTDNGTGTPTVVATAPFDPHRGQRGPSAGAGLGLSISRAIVVAHGGEIDIEDISPGTRFVILLPVGLERDGAEGLVAGPEKVLDV
ncbi:MAG: ATP-binding cassette domain-containing protein [Actinomycetota bacterium]|nr:ATP-binding cassette domain-containing protein [Actinomycetota bacterium]